MIALNCDLGEGYGHWQAFNDEKIMPHIDMANIACGFHAGDPLIMQNTIASAVSHDVAIGAHPSYPDRQGFGRRSMKMSKEELLPLIHYQLAAVEGLSKVQNGVMTYVKPHGALYNDMMRDIVLFEILLNAVSSYNKCLSFVLQATPNYRLYQQIADKCQIHLVFEAFADRAYTDDGLLVSRQLPDAVLSMDQMLRQVENIVSRQQIHSTSGKVLSLPVDTLCVHGDTNGALEAVIKIRKMINQHDV